MKVTWTFVLFMTSYQLKLQYSRADADLFYLSIRNGGSTDMDFIVYIDANTAQYIVSQTCQIIYS